MKLLLVLLFIGLSSADPVAVGDAKPDAKADPWYGYYGWGYPAYSYPSWGWGGYWGYPHYIGKRSADAEPAPEASADAKADPWYYYGNYGWGYPYYSSYYYPAWGGYSYIGKRSADAEPEAAAAPAPTADAKADPWLYYGNYGWGYPYYSSYYYPAWGGYSYIGKRSADAEPEAAAAPAADAKADPWWPYYYGGYGYPAWGYGGWGGYYNRYWWRK
jgi:pyruvate/2-oxoglutarate dehydrogenase complex dihydrolipoamide acyltransferase (E2) component